MQLDEFENKYTPCNHHGNLCHKTIHHLQKFPPTLLFIIIINTYDVRSITTSCLSFQEAVSTTEKKVQWVP